MRQEIHLSRRKKLCFSVLVFVAFVLSFETFARVGSYFYHGRNPYYLFYGYRSWTNEEGEGHSEKLAGYFKFPPDRTIDYGTPEPCRINNQGFRGADFEVQKPEHTFRVVCMGASSTFGYLNNDDETYPYVLERLLGEVPTERDVQVINAGIPHWTTDHIAAALEEELVLVDPDVLTLYTGCNDAIRPLAQSRLQRLCRLLDEYSAGYATLRKGVNASFGEVLFGQWTPYVAQMDRASIEAQIALHRERTRANVERILSVANENGSPLLIIRQPMSTWPERLSRGLVSAEDAKPDYETEYRELAAKLERDGYLPGYEVELYVHHHLIDLFDEIAAEHGLTVVDNIGLVAERPEGLVTRVHLDHEANVRLAKALRDAIVALSSESEAESRKGRRGL